MANGDDGCRKETSVTRPHPDDDLHIAWPRGCDSTVATWYGDAFTKGAPIHLVNVTVNETVDGRSRVLRRNLKGVGMAIGPAGLSAGVRHHLVFERKVSPSEEESPVLPETAFPREPTRFRMFEPSAACKCPEREALTLGQWAGISGASFSTGMGSHTGIGLSLLAGFFNIRLGYWWDSGIRRDGRRCKYRAESACCCAKRCKQACRKCARGASRIFRWFASPFAVQGHLLDEFLARFPGASRRWWYLSDGGHFENLGAYELIRRRVPLILLVDAEADPDYSFEGLGNLVRKARTDFHAEIEFLDHERLSDLRRRLPDGGYFSHFGSLEMLRRVPWDQENVASTRKEKEGWRRVFGPPDRRRYSQAHAALGTVRYEGEAAPRSIVVYIKPTLIGTEPRDLAHYHEAHPDFPHQSTRDQFFDEPQWESYRKLGELIGERVLGKGLDRFARLQADGVFDGSNRSDPASPRS